MDYSSKNMTLLCKFLHLQRGHYLMVRCPTPNDFENWKVSLESQTTDNVKAVHIRPVLNSQPHPSKVKILTFL